MSSGQIKGREMAGLLVLAALAWACILAGAWALGKVAGVSLWHWWHP